MDIKRGTVYTTSKLHHKQVVNGQQVNPQITVLTPLMSFLLGTMTFPLNLYDLPAKALVTQDKPGVYSKAEETNNRLVGSSMDS